VEVPLVALRICELASGGYRGWRQMYLNLALEGARGAPRSQQLFNSGTAHGGKAWDHSGMCVRWCQWRAIRLQRA